MDGRRHRGPRTSSSLRAKLTMVVFRIRATRPDDAAVLQHVERSAGERFRDVDLFAVADHEPLPVEVLAKYARAGRSWVAIDDLNELIGYVLVDVVDNNAHLEQMSVRPDHQGGGIGRALLGCARDWAIDHGKSALTLTTFADVAWNRPLYEHLGFRVLSDGEIGPGLRALREVEAAHGLDPHLRVCMLMDVKRE
jgi:GNAT superfamily N-acetyltransferase